MAGGFYADTLCSISLAKFVTCEETYGPLRRIWDNTGKNIGGLSAFKSFCLKLHYKMCGLQPNLKRIPLSHPSELI